MDLSNRSTACLDGCGIETIDELLRYSKSDLKTIRNLGKRSAKEIARAVSAYGYELRTDN